MQRDLAIYLSGSIQKGETDARTSFWTDDHIRCIKDELTDYEVIILNPSERADDLSDFVGTLGRDLLQVAVADVVVVDARDRRGIGVGAEMAIAQTLAIPVVSVCPPRSHYYKLDFKFFGQQLDEWIHPFVHGLSDARVDDVRSACQWVRASIQTAGQRDVTRASEQVSDAIAHYIRAQLDRDVPMRQLVEKSSVLLDRVESWRRP